MIDEFAHITPAMWLEKEEELLRSVHSLWDGVPLLNISDSRNLPNNRLVKFRGMIQDVPNPILYYEECKVYNTVTKETTTKTMKFSDVLPCEHDEVLYSNNPSNVVRIRQPFFVTTIPGLNKWVRSVEQDIALPVNPVVESSTTQKRPMEDAEMDVGESSSGSPERKRPRTTEPQNPKLSSCPKQTLILQNPQPNRCLVMVYKDADTLKMPNIVEFVGFLFASITPERSHGSDEAMDVQTNSPSPSLVIHCVAFKKIEHCNLLVYGSKLQADRFAYIKNTLHFALTQLMMGDTLAAEYLIYHFISKIYRRNEALGQCCLNISHIPLSVPEFAKCVYEFVELLVPTSQYVAMTVENMNSLPFIPRKNYDSGRLVTGLLQVSNNTHFLLDETKLEPGEFNESGTEALTALRIAIDFQKVAYNYFNCSVNFDCDIAFLILSEGKSLLPSHFHVRLQPDETCPSVYLENQADIKAFVESSLYEIRYYLTQARYENFAIDDNIMEVVQNDFVRLRQSQSISTDDLHQLLVLARLIALSDGKTSLDAYSWNKACELEQKRKSRIN